MPFSTPASRRSRTSRARQAINYAVDRERIIELLDLPPSQDTPTCQMLPADFPGHQSYCPYTSGVKDGSWPSPDMVTERRLARESRTTNVPVTVWSLDGPTYTAAGSYLVQLLKELGYQASLHIVSPDQIYPDLGNPQIKIQIGFGIGFGADFPAPSTFFGPLLSCHMADMPDSNSAEFCDPRVDALASQAQQRSSQAIPPPPGNCGQRPTASSPTRRHTSRSTTVRIPSSDSSPPGSGTTRHPRHTDRCTTRFGSDDRHSRTSSRGPGPRRRPAHGPVNPRRLSTQHSMQWAGAVRYHHDSTPPLTSKDGAAAFRLRDPDLTPTPRRPEGEVGITPAPLRSKGVEWMLIQKQI
jgi:hypothetical protein